MARLWLAVLLCGAACSRSSTAPRFSVDQRGRVELHRNGARWSLTLSQVCRQLGECWQLQPATVSSDTAVTLVEWNHGVRERWETRANGAEQTLTLQRAPRGHGPITVRLRTEGSGAGFRYADAYALLDGQRHSLSVTRYPGELWLTVPAELADNPRAWPLTIDPLVTSAPDFETPPVHLKPEPSAQTHPAVAVWANGGLAVWEDDREGGPTRIMGTRLLGADLVVDPIPLVISPAGIPGGATNPRVAHMGGGEFRVVWEQGDGASSKAGVTAVVADGVVSSIDVFGAGVSTPDVACQPQADTCVVTHTARQSLWWTVYQAANQAFQSSVTRPNSIRLASIAAERGHDNYFVSWLEGDLAGAFTDINNVSVGRLNIADGGSFVGATLLSHKSDERPSVTVLDNRVGLLAFSLLSLQEVALRTIAPNNMVVGTSAFYFPDGGITQYEPAVSSPLVGNGATLVLTQKSSTTGTRLMTASVVMDGGWIVGTTVLSPLTTIGDHQSAPAIAYTNDGGVVAWQELFDTNFDIQAMAFSVDRDGGAVRLPAATLSLSDNGQRELALASANGTTMAVWSDFVIDHQKRLFASMQLVDGGTVFDNRQLAPGSAGRQENASIAYGGGRYLVSWAVGDVQFRRVAVWGELIARDGTASAPFPIDANREAGRIASTWVGNTFLVVYEAVSVRRVFARHQDTSGTLNTSPFQVTAAGSFPSAAYDGTNQLVAWLGDETVPAVHLAKIEANDAITPVSLPAVSARPAAYPVVVADARGHSALLWQEAVDGGTEVQAIGFDDTLTSRFSLTVGSYPHPPAPMAAGFDGVDFQLVFGRTEPFARAQLSTAGALGPLMIGTDRPGQSPAIDYLTAPRVGLIGFESYDTDAGTRRLHYDRVTFDADGSMCSDDSSCSSGACVLGVCCNTRCVNGTCSTGACVNGQLAENGAACSADGECQSTHCVDLICCATGCDDQCKSCGSGVCKRLPATQKVSCNDGVACTTSDVCGDTGCEGKPMVCASGLTCHEVGSVGTCGAKGPVFVSAAPLGARCTVGWQYQPVASGVAPLTFTLGTHPTEMTIDGGGTIRWTPGPGASTAQVSITVTDAAGLTAEQSFTIDVACPDELSLKACGCNAGLGGPLLAMLAWGLRRRRARSVFFVGFASLASFAGPMPLGPDGGPVGNRGAGESCNFDIQCASGVCAGNVCCEGQCGECESCADATRAGQCTPLPNGTACGAASGAFCSDRSQCVTGACVGLMVVCSGGEVCDETARGCVSPSNGAHIVHDAYQLAALGTPWPYNQRGRVAATGSPAFRICSGSLSPVGFSVSAEGIVSWVPDAVGTYQLCIEAFGSGASDTYSFDVAVIEPSEDPRALMVVSPQPGKPMQELSFDGRTSAPSRPMAAIQSWVWRFGDGSAPASGAVVKHVYAHAGTFVPRLTVVDSLGRADTISTPVAVLDDAAIYPPVARIEASTAYGDEPLLATVRCDCTELSATIIGRRWDFGDGETSIEAEPSHLYRTAGRYTLRLKVIDANGLTATDEIDVSVARGGVEAPQCLLSASPNYAAVTYGTNIVALTDTDSANVVITTADGEKHPTKAVSDVVDRPGRFFASLEVSQNGLSCFDRVELVGLEGDAVVPELFAIGGSAARCEKPWSPPTLVASGTGPFSWSLQGQKPAGLQIEVSTGMLSWTPSSAQRGPVSFVVRAQNAAGIAEQPISFTVDCDEALKLSVSACDASGTMPLVLLALGALRVGRRFSRRARNS